MHLQDRVLQPHKHRHVRKQVVLDDIDLHVAPGEWVGLYGPNGSGKTTFLKILAGLLPADAGTVERRGLLSCFFDLGAGFHDERSLSENLYIHALLHGIDPLLVAAMEDRIIAFAGLEEQRNLPMKCCSMGMKLRLGFAAMVHVDADIYLIDELLAVGDEAFKRQCLPHLASMRTAGKTGIVVSHALDELETICDRILFFESGRISEERVMRSPLSMSA